MRVAARLPPSPAPLRYAVAITRASNTLAGDDDLDDGLDDDDAFPSNRCRPPAPPPRVPRGVGDDDLDCARDVPPASTANDVNTPAVLHPTLDVARASSIV